MKRNQKGFTLIEMSIVLVIIAVLAVMGTRGVGIYKQTKNESEAQTINRVILALQTKFRNDTTTTGLTNTVVNNTGVLNKSGWTFAAGTITHGMKGTVTFAPATIASADDAIGVTMATVPYSSCGDIGRNATQHAEKITIGTTVVQTASTTPATGIAIDAACGTTGTVTMAFVYDKNP